MSKQIILRNYKDGSYISVGQGTFDNFCVYYKDANGSRKALRNADYFKELIDLGDKYGNNFMYEIYLMIYDKTTRFFDVNVLKEIENISEMFGEDSLRVDKLMTQLYLASVAEENKFRSVLGKRIKLLGVYGVLKEGQSAELASILSCDQNHKILSKLCDDYGI